MNRLKWITFLLFIACTTATIQAKERVIERPPFIGWNSTILEVEKIVLSDTATVLHAKAYFRPNYWINLEDEIYLKDNNNMKYPIRLAVGIPLNKRYFMPESGEKSFQLIFPPLPESVTSVDFHEGDPEKGWKIWGIQLKSNKLPALELPKISAKTDKKATLPNPEYKLGKATLKGRILEYRPGMPKTLKCLPSGCLKLTGRDVNIDVAEDGSFSKEIPVATVTPAIFYLNNTDIPFYLAPGEETVVHINTRELTRSESRLRKDEKPLGEMVYYDGYMAGISAELNTLRKSFKTENDYDKLFKESAGKTMDELKDNFLKEKDEMLAKIEAYKMSPAAKAILKADINMLTIHNIHMIPGIYRQAYIVANKLNREQTEEYYKQPIETPEDLFKTGLKDFTDINSPAYMYSSKYYMVVTNPYLATRLKEATGINDGMFTELSKVAETLEQITDFQPATEEQLNEISQFSSPVFAQLITFKNEELAKTIEANKKKTGFTVNEVGEVVNEDLFPSLIAKYKGKVVLVDFWATWCGPCVMANKEMKPMKEELKGEDIAYLYIAGENSPEKTWENMIPDIAGDHVRVNNEQWEYLATTFGVRGVPTYLVLDKEGNITYKQVGFPGVDQMKAELKKASK